jgi:Ca2+-binding RTX toxin-like protein
MLGYSGDDILDGGTGTNYAWGGAGNDIFVLNNDSGTMVINDFVAGGTDDAIRLTGSSLTDWAAVQAASTYYGGLNTTIITLDADTNIWLIGVGPGQLTASDFIF